jgi:hypothetical protein
MPANRCPLPANLPSVNCLDRFEKGLGVKRALLKGSIRAACAPRARRTLLLCSPGAARAPEMAPTKKQTLWWQARLGHARWQNLRAASGAPPETWTTRTHFGAGLSLSKPFFVGAVHDRGRTRRRLCGLHWRPTPADT